MSELRTLSRQVGTVLAGQLATMAFGVTDTIVAGRYSEASLAALSVGAAIYMSVYVALMGVLQALLPVWAELHGANRPTTLGRSFRQSLYLTFLTLLVGLAVLLNPAPILTWSEVPTDLRAEVESYLAVLALALAPSLLFRQFSTLNQSLGRPSLVTGLQLGSLAFKIPLSVWFAFGGWGVPALGAVGCAWATLAVNTGMFLTALGLLLGQRFYRPYKLWHRLEAPDWPLLASFARLGVPSGLAILVEVTSFTLMALFIARLGTVAAASHQIASNLAAVLYMTPLAIGIATSARASYWLGANQPSHARHVIWLGFKMALGCAAALSSSVLLLRANLAALYATSAEVIAVAAQLLAWVALYNLFDSLQAVGVFVLRCFRVTLAPLLVYGVLLWGGGLYGGYLLAYHGLGSWPALQAPQAFWITSAAALALTATAFWWMVTRILSRQHRPPG